MSRRYKIGTALIGMSGILLLVSFLLVPPVWELTRRTLTVRQGERLVEVGPGTSDWVPIDQMEEDVIGAVLSTEDHRFFAHFGVSPVEIWRSLIVNLKTRRYARGGSTLTQQVVRTVFLDSDKNLLRKAREIIGALVLERIVDKEDILAWYFNLARFGEEVYGIRAAARLYFAKEPKELTLADGVKLSILLPRPKSMGRELASKDFSPDWKRKFHQSLETQVHYGWITEGQAEIAKKESP